MPPPSVLAEGGREGQAKSTTAAKAPSKSAETARRRSAGRPFLYLFHLTRHLTSDLTLDIFHGLFTFVLLGQLLVGGREN